MFSSHFLKCWILTQVQSSLDINDFQIEALKSTYRDFIYLYINRRLNFYCALCSLRAVFLRGTLVIFWIYILTNYWVKSVTSILSMNESSFEIQRSVFGNFSCTVYNVSIFRIESHSKLIYLSNLNLISIKESFGALDFCIWTLSSWIWCFGSNFETYTCWVERTVHWPRPISKCKCFLNLLGLIENSTGQQMLN